MEAGRVAKGRLCTYAGKPAGFPEAEGPADAVRLGSPQNLQAKVIAMHTLSRDFFQITTWVPHAMETDRPQETTTWAYKDRGVRIAAHFT